MRFLGGKGGYFEKLCNGSKTSDMTSEEMREVFECDSADTCTGKVPLISMGGRAESLACSDPGARTPIGVSGNIYDFADIRFLQTCKQYFWRILWKYFSYWITLFCRFTYIDLIRHVYIEVNCLPYNQTIYQLAKWPTLVCLFFVGCNII